jgi:hypothetical protein
LDGIIFSIVGQFLAGILIIIPLGASLDNCKRSRALASEYAFSRVPVPRKILKQLSETRTLCFTHPFSRAECSALMKELPRT